MKLITRLSLVLFLFTVFISAQSKKKIEFSSEDGLKITADLYMVHSEEKPFIVLFHQAGWSRGEYLEIAPKLNKIGFNCMAELIILKTLQLLMGAV